MILFFSHTHTHTQRNEIDLNALMLMSEQDFAEIGLPAVSVCMLFNIMSCLVDNLSLKYITTTTYFV